MEIEKLSKGKYLAHSDSGEVYQIQLSGEDKNVISCSCRGFMFRRQCKHIDEVKKLLGKKEVKVKSIPTELFQYIQPYKTSIKKLLES